VGEGVRGWRVTDPGWLWGCPPPLPCRGLRIAPTACSPAPGVVPEEAEGDAPAAPLGVDLDGEVRTCSHPPPPNSLGYRLVGNMGLLMPVGSRGRRKAKGPPPPSSQPMSILPTPPWFPRRPSGLF